MKLENGRIYLGETYNRTYIGRYNESTDELSDVFGIVVGQDGQVQMIPAASAVILLRKITGKLNTVNIDVKHFMFIVDPDGLEYGDGLKQVYIETTTGVVTDANEADLEDAKEKSGIILD